MAAAQWDARAEDLVNAEACLPEGALRGLRDSVLRLEMDARLGSVRLFVCKNKYEIHYRTSTYIYTIYTIYIIYQVYNKKWVKTYFCVCLLPGMWLCTGKVWLYT